MTKSPDAEEFHVAGFRTIEDADNQFSSFKSMYEGGYERYISAGMGIVFLSPKVLSVPEDPEALRKYITSDRIQQLGGLGYYTGPVIKVESSILTDFEIVSDVANKIIHQKI